MDLSILICSFSESKYLSQTLDSIIKTLPKDLSYELLVDTELERTGIENTPNRYQSLFTRATGNYIVKSDDDVFYFQGWLEECLKALKRYKTLAYISPLNHFKTPSLSKYTPMPIIDGESIVSTHSHIAGACWVFHRSLWELVPYSSVAGIRTLDSHYAALVRKTTRLHPGYLSNVLCSHLGIDRNGGKDEPHVG